MFFNVVQDLPNSVEIMTQVLKTIVGPRDKVFECFIEKYQGTEISPEQLTTTYSKMTHDAVCACPNISGAQELLELLISLPLKTYLSSATPLPQLRLIIEEKGWNRYFTDIYGAPQDKTDTLKNHIIPTLKQAKNIAVVGDGEDDLQSAQNVHARFFPVGEARGTTKSDHIYSLDELKYEILKLHIA